MKVLGALTLVAAAVGNVSAQAAKPTSTKTSTKASSSAHTTATATSTTPIETSTPTISSGLDNPLPSQQPLPPKQAWCPSEIFCAGSLLQTLNVAHPYADSKTIVDKPTNGTGNATLTEFNRLAANGVTKITYGQIVNFEEHNFRGEGLELQAVSDSKFPTAPKFLTKVKDSVVRGFANEVHKVWNLLIRQTDSTQVCKPGVCESSLIPLNHTFVVPGGRFREQYYWDSYFIVEGLLLSELYDVVRSSLENFMDELEQFGFIPNGGRIYYLNRSQPPLFIPMLFNYVNSTGDTSILVRGLPLAEKELAWWDAHRTINVTSPYTKKKHSVFHYAVNNSAPRPESYFEDYQTANLDPSTSVDAKSAIYAELASGAETGWDYSSRWIKQPFLGNLTYNLPALRTLNVRNTVPVDLNSILYRARTLLAELYYPAHPAPDAVKDYGQSDKDRAAYHRLRAQQIKTAVLDLFWSPDKLAFYDFNVTANARGTAFTAAHYYPLWANIFPDKLLSDENAAFGAFSSLNLVLNRFNGTFPATFVETGLQWDWPNSWPPHIYIALQALANVPAKIANSTLPELSRTKTAWSFVPKGQLGITEAQLPLQPVSIPGQPDGGSSVPRGADGSALPGGGVVNGGVVVKNEGWAKALARELANRYTTSVFCSWRATGGSIPGLLPKLSDAELNVTQSIGQDGHLFEKFSATDVDSAGRGGEYAVQAGFGWTNGVLLWVTSNYGSVVGQPACPKLI